MVGPRSTGCRTCVRRRVRCDETRPHCRRCQVAGFDCVGYTPPLRFLPPVTLRKSSSAADKDDEAEESRPTKPKEARRSSNSAPRQIVVSRNGNLTVTMPGLNFVPDIAPAPSSFTDDAYCIFFLDRYFCFDNWNGDLQNNKTWFWRSLQWPSQYPVSNAATRALAATFFAQVHKTDSLNEYIHDLHGRALKTLASEIQIAPLSFDVLAANSVLHLYSICAYTSENSWPHHVRAMRSLYQKMGPDYFRHGQGKALLMMNRYAIICRSLLTSEECFLAEEPWSNILTSGDREASMTIRLGDMVVHMPGVFERVKKLQRLPDPSQASEEARQVFSRLVRHLQDLKDWWVEWSSDPLRMPMRTPLVVGEKPMMSAPPTSPEGWPLTFCNLEASSGWCRYHTHVILTLVWMSRLLAIQIPDTIPHELYEQSPDLIEKSGETFKLQVGRAKIQQHAEAICEALHFFTMPRYRHIGAPFMGLSVRVAWQALPRDSACALWIEEMLQFMSIHSGFVAPSRILHKLDVEFE